MANPKKAKSTPLEGTKEKVSKFAEESSQRPQGERTSGRTNSDKRYPDRNVLPKASEMRRERTHTELYINWFLDRFRLVGEEKPSELRQAFKDEFKRGASVFNRMYRVATELFQQEVLEIRHAKKEMYLSKELEAHMMGLNDKHLHALELNEQIFRLEEVLEQDFIKDADRIGVERQITAIRKQLGDWYGFNAPEEKTLTFAGLVPKVKF